ncbi:MAG: class I SAM-dependent methyltransferase [Candidatus Thermoplasmatota archaeon]|nr:class I SAM-dependent methyltransferase [Candidatus Thermoplasmatota archaeon]
MLKNLLDRLYNIYEIIFTNISFFSFLYRKLHEPSVKKEIAMADISPTDTVLHIGCGAIPYSLIIFSKQTHACITGIDNQPRSITKAKKFVAGYKNIHVEHASGETYDVSTFDIILISYGIDDIEAVLKNALHKLKNNGKIILRKPMTETTEYIDSVIKKYSRKKLKLLLSQESFLIVKQ